MKYFGGFWTKAVTWGAVICAAAVLGSMQAAQGTAKVRAIRAGSAQVTYDGATWSTLTVGTELRQGAKITTDQTAIVDLFLGDNGPVVRVTPSTTLDLNVLSIDRSSGEKVIQTELGLSSGRILGVVRKLTAASRYEIKTPNGTCGIRGTKYAINVSGLVIVLEGTADVWYIPPTETQPIKYEVPAGFTFDPTGNNNRGEVVETPASVRADLIREIEDFYRMETAGERVQIWVLPPKQELTTETVGAASPPSE
ncbi:MAG: hypothetical protein FJ387_22070 [Verrucomicrobia bacterium]|nr:hypothetical protein [Verrucomicrobiota bacterium]